MRKLKMNRMIVLIAIGIIAGLIPLIMIGCDLVGVTIEKRIEDFLDDLNNIRGNAYTNFHPTDTSYYVLGTIKPAGFWDTDFPVGVTQYTLGSINDSDPLNVLVTINGPTGFGRGGTGTDDFTLKMTEDGSDWLIEELWYSGGSVIVQ
ncbi:MAG: hypothetical protein JSV89_00715 [Spirochaetaceae bacterium]|nr:MAG: hypothetical protein JSV89_00715 [Spirochaetaceae bacterium]